MGIPLEERLLSKIQMEPNSGCWLWTAHIGTTGYGEFMHKGKKRNAHRVLYEHFIGHIPRDLDLDHLCRVRSCVNPDHLEPVTRSENCRRGLTGAASGAQMLAKTHCPSGHEYTPENTRPRGTSRYCKQCGRDRRKAWGAKNSAHLKEYMKNWSAKRAMERSIGHI